MRLPTATVCEMFDLHQRGNAWGEMLNIASVDLSDKCS